jgi:ABC-type nitrate/sulfonate/bicarbonate transport system substrate-binding protein
MRPSKICRVLVSASFAWLAVTWAPAIAHADAATPLAIGDVAPIAPDWPSFVAKDKGFYQKAGVDPQVTYVGNVANTVQQMVGGSFGIAVSTFDTAIRAIAKGADAVMIGGLVVKYPYSIMSDAKIKTAADMKGKRIILPFQKDLLTFVWNEWVKSNGVAPKSIDQVYDGATPNRYAALVAHQVQAALVSQPFDFRAAAEGYHKLLDIGAYGKNYGFLVLLSKPSWLKGHAKEARGFLMALSEAVNWLYDEKNRDEAIKILAAHTKLPPQYAAQTYDYYIKELKPFSHNLAIPHGIVDATVKTLVEIGDIKESEVQAAKIIDTSYLPK